MTAILALNLGDRVVMMSDTAATDYVGRVVTFHPKMHVIAAAKSILAMSGPAVLSDFLDHLDREGRPFVSAEDLWSRLGREVHDYHSQRQDLRGRERLIVFVATLDGAPRLGEIYGEWGSDQPPKCSPWVLVDRAALTGGRGMWWVMAGGPDPEQVPQDFVTWFQANSGQMTRRFDPEMQGRQFFSRQRSIPIDGRFYGGGRGFYGVGGHVDVVEISAKGISSTTLEMGWKDEQYQFIDPQGGLSQDPGAGPHSLVFHPSSASRTSASVGEAAAGKFLSASGTWEKVAPAVRGYLSGLALSNNVTNPNTQVDVAAGVATDDNNAMLFQLSAATINLAATGANGLDAGSLANNTTYHIFAIGKADGTVSRLASTSPTAPTMPSGYTLKRRLGSVLTNASAQVRGFVQIGNEFLLRDMVRNLATYVPGTSAYLASLTVPSGVQVGAIVTLGIYYAVGSGYALMTSPDQTDAAPGAAGGYNALVNASLTFSSDSPGPIRTNSSAQIRLRCSHASTQIDLYTRGWVDYL